MWPEKICTDESGITWTCQNGYLLSRDEIPMKYLYLYSLTTTGGLMFGNIYYVRAIKEHNKYWSIIHQKNHKSAQISVIRVLKKMFPGVIPITMD